MASSAAPPTPDALSNNAPHGSHFRPPTKTHRINSHDNYPDAAGQKGFAEKLKCLLAQYPEVRPEQLDIEIVESVLLGDMPGAIKNINDCQSLGVTFSLDDFGTGYSSLSYLEKLDTQSIKIDQSFIRGILNDKKSLLLTIAIIGLAKSFNRQVIAEGVETVEQADLLMRLGCDIAQGYVIAKPMPAEHVLQWVEQFVKIGGERH